ncbi:MAG: hypothetical protein WA938_04235, partial [Candidatus Dormiibacterota bacterium]
MPRQRRAIAYTVLLLALLVIAVLAWRVTPTKNLPTRSTGQLQQALANYQLKSEGKKVPSGQPIIASSPKYEAQVVNSEESVNWWTVGGHEYQSVIDSTDPTSLFSKYGYTDYSIQAPSSDNVFLTLILPNLIIVLVILAFIWFMLRQSQSGNNQALSFGRSRARLVAGDKPEVTFVDVAGVD